ncbi:MAG: aldo/keto reductase [Bacteroidota bacterium]
MNYRLLGKTNFKIAELSLGTWQVGGKWGSGFDSANAERILHQAIDRGINFIDTADVYESGMSEAAVGRVIRQRKEQVYLATKCGRQINPHESEGYQVAVLRKFVEDSLRNTGLETLDLIQLHCPPNAVYYRPEIFGLFERLQQEGKIQHLGVSVEKVEEALKAIEYDNVSSVQIIFNIFRQRPSQLFFAEAKKRQVGIIVRVPLASGLLTGKYSTTTVFGKDDHRYFNREGAAFDKGETFSGIPYEQGLAAVDALKQVFPGVDNLAPYALKWVLSFAEVSCVIPGVSRPEQLDSNLAALELPTFTPAQMNRIQEIYEDSIRPVVHHLW